MRAPNIKRQTELHKDEVRNSKRDRNRERERQKEIRRERAPE